MVRIRGQNGNLPMGERFLGQQWGVRSPAGMRGHGRLRRQHATFTACCLLAIATSLTLQFALGVAPEVCIIVGMAITYGGFTECVRMAAVQDRNVQLTAKVKQLLEGRRASGLKRLGQEVGRLQMWPRPPYSYTATVLRRFDAERSSPIQEREVDYRGLARDLVAKIVESVGGDEGMEHDPGSPPSPVHPATSAALRTWLLQRLMHEGPTPERDPDLFKSLHDIVDIAEDHVIEGFFCRLCLSYHSGNSKMQCVELECGKCLCGRCAKEMVEGVLDGRIRVPVACPTGHCNAVLSPDLVQDIVSADDFERFQRMHSVKMSLDKSAPHKRDLASQLAQARQAGGLALPTVSERQQQRGPSSAGETDSRAPSPEDSIHSPLKGAPPRVQTTELGWASSSQVNHSTAMPRSPTSDGGSKSVTHMGGTMDSAPVPMGSPRSSPELNSLRPAALTRSRSGGGGNGGGGGGVCFANLLRPLTFDSQQGDQQKKRHHD